MPLPSPRRVGVIYRREMLDLLRDRRTLFGMILVPILIYPVLMVAASSLLVEQVNRIEQQLFAVAVTGWRDLPELQEGLKGQGVRWSDRTDTEALRRELAEGKVHVLIEVPPDAARRIDGGETVELTATYNGADENSLAAWRRFEPLLEEARRAMSRRRLQERAVDPSVLDPFRVTAQNAASARRQGAFLLGRVVCVMLVMMAAMGAFYPAVDAASGEKERGTMQTLLVSPARRSEIVLGKYLSVLTVCGVTSVLNLASMGITFSNFFGDRFREAHLEFAPAAGSIGLMLLLLLPLAGLFSAVCLALSAYASGYKEAMLYLSPFLLAASLGSFAPLVPGLQPSFLLEWVPVANGALTLYRVVQETATAGQVALNFAVNTLYALLALRWVWWIFEREDVLLRGTAEVHWRFWERPATLRQHPSIVEGLVYCCLFLTLATFLAAWQRRVPFLAGLFLTQFVVLLLPMALLLYVGGIDARRALRLRAPGWQNLAIAALSAAALMYVAHAAIETLMGWSKDRYVDYTRLMEEEMKPFLDQLGRQATPAGVVAAVAAIAGLAPLCEELAFRGFLLSSLRPVLGAALGVGVTGLLFGLLHGPILPRQLPLVLVGICFGAMVVRTGSLWVGVAAHAVYNGTALTLARREIGGGAAQEGGGASPGLVILALIVVGMGFWLLEPFTPRRVSAQSPPRGKTEAETP